MLERLRAALRHPTEFIEGNRMIKWNEVKEGDSTKGARCRAWDHTERRVSLTRRRKRTEEKMRFPLTRYDQLRCRRLKPRTPPEVKCLIGNFHHPTRPLYILADVLRHVACIGRCFTASPSSLEARNISHCMIELALATIVTHCLRLQI